VITRLWTDEKPKDSGHYWHKDADGNIEIVEVSIKRRVMMRGAAYEQKLSETNGKWSQRIQAPSLRQANKLEKGLKELTLVVTDVLIVLEKVMTEKESALRGAKVAKLSNVLDFANDSAMHFALGMEFNAMNAMKEKRKRLVAKSDIVIADVGQLNG
jgi:hypothetical protein